MTKITYQIIVIFLFCINTISCSTEEDDNRSFLEKGAAFIEQGEINKAKLAIKNAIKENPKSAEAFYYMAMINEQDKRYKAMRSNLIEAVSLDPKSIKARVKLGKVFSLFNEIERSFQEISSILELEPENVDARALKASILIKQKSYQEANLIIDDILHKDPGQIDALSLKTLLHINNQEYDEALAVLMPALLNDQDNVSLLLLKIQIDTKINDIDALIESYEKLASLNPENIQIKKTLSKIYSKGGKKTNAEAVLRALVKDFPDRVDTKLSLLNFLYLEDRGNALVQLNEYINTENKNYSAKILFAKWLLSKNNKIKAIEILNQLVVNTDVKKKDQEAATLLLAKLDFSNKKFDKVLTLVENLLKQSPENLEAKLLKAQVLAAEDKYAQAISIINKILLDKPRMDQALSTLGYINVLQGDMDKAYANYNDALAINRKNQRALFFLVDREVSKGHLEYAITLLEKSLASLPNSRQILTRLIQLTLQEKKWDEAKKYVDRFLLQKNGALFSYYLKGRMLQQQDKISDAITMYKQGLQKYPWQKNTLLALSECYEKLNETPKMINFLDQFIRDNPNNVFSYVLNSQLLSANKSYKKAIELLIKAKQNASLRKVPLQIELARVYSLTGNTEAEFKAYQEGLNESNDNIDLLLFLAIHLEKKGESIQAIEQYEKILNLDSKHKIAKNNLATLLVNNFSDEKNLSRALKLATSFKQSREAYFLDTYGWTLLKNGDLRNALSVFQKVIILEPDVSIFRYHLAMAYYQLSDEMTATSELKQALYMGKGKEFPEKKLIQELLNKIKNK